MDQHFYMLRRGIENRIANVEFDDVNARYEVHPSKRTSTKVVVHDTVSAIAEGVDKTGWVFYTDASASSYGIGWSYVAFKHGMCVTRSSRSLTRCSIFMAEAYAVLQVARCVNCIQGVTGKEEIEIRSDAQGLVRTLSKTVHVNVVLRKIKEELRKATENGKKVVLRWVPGHKGISGNELADGIAKKAVDSQWVTPIPVLKQDVMLFIKEKEAAGRNNIWKNFVSKNVKLFLPDVNALNIFLKQTPTAALCQLVSGHTRLNDFMCRKLGVIGSALCECGEDDETISHFLFDCVLYDDLRTEIWGTFQLD